MKLGDLEFHILNDGTFGLDGGAMFGVIPRPMWERVAPPDERNRIRLRMNSLLIRSGGEADSGGDRRGRQMGREAARHLQASRAARCRNNWPRAA